MQVFLVPVGPGRYEPYCEVGEDAQPARTLGADAPQGWVRWAVERFRAVLATAERHRLQPPGDAPATWPGRVRARVLCFVAEKIAEQRLLWHLRKEDAAELVYPAHLHAQEAVRLLKASLQADADRHLRWGLVDALLFAITGPLLFLVPGPNLVAYYFAFRMVGHWLSYRGAKHGRDGVVWSPVPSVELTELERLLALDPAERAPRVSDIASRLRLEHLPRFFDRVALKSA